MRTGSECPDLLLEQARGEKTEGDLVASLIVGFAFFISEMETGEGEGEVSLRCWFRQRHDAEVVMNDSAVVCQSRRKGRRNEGRSSGLLEQTKGEKKRGEIWLLCDVAGCFCPSVVIGLWPHQRNEGERGEVV
ncbi:hypothetical protein HAX54_005412, partial [Datura stramonium]|nr:hypothetical protein [Datura stramonium]